MPDSCIFCEIANGRILAGIVFQDDETAAFKDMNAQAPVHVLVVPRRHISSVNELGPGDAETVGKLFLAAKQIAGELNIAHSGYRLVMNCGRDGGQTVDHIHLHLLGGRPFKWPPG
jgi:histidine triad (HIT) family protein